MTVTVAGFTGDSNAPLRDVKKIQFGILGPEEVVGFISHAHNFNKYSFHTIRATVFISQLYSSPTVEM